MKTAKYFQILNNKFKLTTSLKKASYIKTKTTIKHTELKEINLDYKRVEKLKYFLEIIENEGISKLSQVYHHEFCNKDYDIIEDFVFEEKTYCKRTVKQKPTWEMKKGYNNYEIRRNFTKINKIYHYHAGFDMDDHKNTCKHCGYRKGVDFLTSDYVIRYSDRIHEGEDYECIITGVEKHSKPGEKYFYIPDLDTWDGFSDIYSKIYLEG